MESFPDTPTVVSSVKLNGDGTAENDLGRRARSGSGGSAHKRALSGSLFSRLQFLKSSPDERSQDGGVDRDTSGNGGSGASGTQQKKNTRRKGSLRKTALLGGRERKSSDARSKSPMLNTTLVPEELESHHTTTPTKANDATPRQSYDHPQRPELPNPQRWSSPRISIASIDSTAPSIDPPSSTVSITSPTAPTEASFTDDDELIEFPRLQTNTLRKLPSSSGDSYFPPLVERGRSSSKKTSPLATQSHSEVESPIVEEDWDYSETAYWGYVILIVTWLVFVVGMGSCFGVWSWAWDVGETPYAPPELEDDPTLPIVGYYPALLVLTAVMSWVWVITSWVGLKYFRHADYGRDDD